MGHVTRYYNARFKPFELTAEQFSPLRGGVWSALKADVAAQESG
jgi:hypothetical protein